MKSESIELLATALSKAQAEMPGVKMSGTNPFFHSSYATLGDVIETVTPILAKHGLSVSQFPVSSTDQVGVSTILMHESGQWIENSVFLPLPEEKGKSLAQVAGSILSYIRRDAISSALNLYTEEDDDGNSSMTNEAKKLGAVEKPIEVPLDNVADMSMDLARSITTSKGKKYGDCTPDELSYMYAAISKREPSEENKIKINAIQTILKAQKK